MQNRIKEIRQEKNLSQTDIAKALGVTRQAISLYEKGDRELKLETWQKLADFFNVPVDYLLGISKDRSTLTIDDLNAEEQDAYNRITDMLCEEYPEDSISWSKIGQLLINSAEE